MAVTGESCGCFSFATANGGNTWDIYPRGQFGTARFLSRTTGLESSFVTLVFPPPSGHSLFGLSGGRKS